MKPFEHYWSQGNFSRQAHRDLPEGTFEREIGRDGFGGPASHIYHPRPPTGWESIEGPLRPRAFNLNKVPRTDHPFDSLPLLTSPALSLAYWRTETAMSSLACDADGDLLFFLHAGQTDFFCDLGHMSLQAGDYLVVPRGIVWRFATVAPLDVLILKTRRSRVQAPEKGLLGRHALWDASMLDYPKLNDDFRNQPDSPCTVVVRRSDQLSRIHYPHNPLDAVGWKGDCVPVSLSITDLLPINSHRYHLPPSVHATFACDVALISTFVPRPFETDETAIKVPFFHNNNDIDEVIFYHEGDFFSRDGIDKGHMSLHPNGITHGPHPNALKRMYEHPDSSTNEYAVMIDSLEQLEPTELALADEIEQNDYLDSWKADS